MSEDRTDRVSQALHRVATGLAGQHEAEILAGALLVWHPVRIPPPRRQDVLVQWRAGDGSLAMDVAYVDGAGVLRLIGGDPDYPVGAVLWARIPRAGQE